MTVRAELEAAARRAVLTGALAAIAPISIALPLLLGIHGYGIDKALSSVGIIFCLFIAFLFPNYHRLKREHDALCECLELSAAGKPVPRERIRQAFVTCRSAVRSFQIISTAGWLVGLGIGLWLFSTQGDLTSFSATMFASCFLACYLFTHGLSWYLYKSAFGPLLGRFVNLLSDEEASALAPLTLNLKIVIGLVVVLGIFGSSLVSIVVYQRRSELAHITLNSLQKAAVKEAQRLNRGEDPAGSPYREFWPAALWFVLEPDGRPGSASWANLDKRLQKSVLESNGAGTFANPLFEQVAAVEPLSNGKRLVVVLSRNDFGHSLEIPALVVLLGVIIIAAVAFQAFTVIRDITRPLEQLRDSAARLAAGDLRNPEKPYADDEVGALLIDFGRAARKLSKAIDDSQQLAQSVASATEQLASTAVTLVSWSEQVRGDSTRAGEMLSRIATGSQEVDSVMKATRAEAARASEKAGAGEDDLVMSARGMNQLGQSLGEVFAGIENLSDRSERIAGIVDVIREITAQTNLLSLNAAIEAARAGEHGRGFGVVADEIRKLADRANASATEINDIVKQVTDTSVKTAAMVQAARQDFGSRQQAVGDTATSFHEITVAFSEAERAFEKLEQLAAEHSKLSAESATALQNIVQTQSEQTTAAEQLRATSTELTRMSENLSRQLQTFRLDHTR